MVLNLFFGSLAYHSYQWAVLAPQTLRASCVPAWSLCALASGWCLAPQSESSAKHVLAADLLCSQACSAPCQERNWESQVNSSLPAFSIRISSCTGSYLLKKGPIFLDRLALQAFQTPRPPSWWLLAAVESSISKTVLKNSCGSFLQKQFSFSLGLFS